jgi:polyisoprenoid-binding protein YceI
MGPGGPDGHRAHAGYMHVRTREEGTMPEEIPGYVAGTWDLDPVHSHVGFVARHLMVSKVRGKFNKFDVQVVTAPEPTDSTVNVIIDTASVDTGNQMRDDDIRSERFLDTDNHPQMTFRSSSVTAHGDKWKVAGDLAIRGVTKPATLDVEVNGFGPDPYGGTRAGFTATTEINRNDFGVSFNAPIPGGVMVSEKIGIEIEAEAVLRKDA